MVLGGVITNVHSVVVNRSSVVRERRKPVPIGTHGVTNVALGIAGSTLPTPGNADADGNGKTKRKRGPKSRGRRRKGGSETNGRRNQ